MVVVLVIGILVAVAVPVFKAAKESAEKNTCFANQRTLEGLWQQYTADAGAPPQTLYMEMAVSSGYLKKEPVCPSWVRDPRYHVHADGTGSHHYYLAYGNVYVYRPNEADTDVDRDVGCFSAIPGGHGWYRN